jgi:hypothetical protein
MSAYAAAAAAIRTALEHLRGADTQGKDATLTAAIGDLERVATLLAERTKPAAPPRVCLGCGSTKCRPGACNRATARKPAAPPAVKDKPAAQPAAKSQAAPATPPAPKREKPVAAKPAPDDFAGLKGYARLRHAVKDAEGLKTVPKGDKASLLARLAKAKPAANAATPPTVPGLFVPDGRGGYRLASEVEVWAALEAHTGKKAA